MAANDTILKAAFINSGEEAQVPLDDLVSALTHFLENFGEQALVGE